MIVRTPWAYSSRYLSSNWIAVIWDLLLLLEHLVELLSLDILPVDVALALNSHHEGHYLEQTLVLFLVFL